MNFPNHPDEYKTGTRCLLLKGRNKDGLTDQRTFHRVSHNAEQFDIAIDELHQMSKEGERIYASASPRNIRAAARLFNKRMQDAAFDQDPMIFYRAIPDRWLSCLMRHPDKDDKRWMFDCDTTEEYLEIMDHLIPQADVYYYVYPSKTGRHVITKPFRRDKFPEELLKKLDTNPLMLWGY